MDSHYNKENKNFARRLRNNSTLGEVILWNKVLKGRKFNGYQFLRQYAIGNYIVDFACRNLKLIIEVNLRRIMREIFIYQIWDLKL